MSSSDAFAALDLSQAIARVAAAATCGDVLTTRDLTSLTSSAVRLYAAAVERSGSEPSPLEPGVATTEAMMLACALVRSQGLNPFDLALWFAHTRPSEPLNEVSG